MKNLIFTIPIIKSTYIDTSYKVDDNHLIQLLLAVYICSCFVHFSVVLFVVLYHSLHKGEFIFMKKNITYKVMVTHTPIPLARRSWFDMTLFLQR